MLLSSKMRKACSGRRYLHKYHSFHTDVPSYKKAYNSMKACPVLLQHPSQAEQLYGVGPKLCERLTERMETHCRQNGLPIPANPRKSELSVALARLLLNLSRAWSTNRRCGNRARRIYNKASTEITGETIRPCVAFRRLWNNTRLVDSL